jgi:type II secretory pathway pseudopilin PulG
MKNLQSGQTLIETLVAAFVLTMGISAALGLATYSLHATSNVKQRIIAIGLAREGIEAVKNMRDTNWLQGSISQYCYYFQDGPDQGSNIANCYQDWLNPGTAKSYDIQGVGGVSGVKTYFLYFDSTSERYWQLVAPNGRPYYGLNYSTDDFSRSGFYNAPPEGVSVSNSNSGYGRAITITMQNDTFPFNQNTGPRLKVTSDVWWSDKNCPVSDTIPVDAGCKITLETYLTNWKTF